jgi:hypothetical protein
LILRKLNVIISLSALLTGLVLGYFIGVNGKEDVLPEVQLTESVKIVHDTIVKQKIVKVDKVLPLITTDSLKNDSLLTEVILLDTAQEKYIEKYKDTLTDDNITIKTDKIIASKKVSLIYIDDSDRDKDSTIKEMLNIKEINNKFMIIEFWESPLNYNGYKLSKSKLVVYGLSPQLNIKIYKTKVEYILKTDNIYYKLIESPDFLSLVEIDKPSIIND